MTSVWASLTVDARDPARLACWWAEALGYQVVTEKPDEVEIRQSAERLPSIADPEGNEFCVLRQQG